MEERGTRKNAKQCQVKYDYHFNISHRATQVLRQVNPLDTRDFSRCSRKKNLCLRVIDGAEEGDGIYLATSRLSLAFLWSYFTPQGVNSPAFLDCIIQILLMLLGPHPRPHGLVSHPGPEVAARARNSKQGTGCPSSIVTSKEKGPFLPGQLTG